MKEGREGVKAKIEAREDRQIRFSRAEASVFHYPGSGGRWVLRVARARWPTPWNLPVVRA